MTNSPKARRGHQKGRSPVIGARLPDSLHRQIRAAAKRAGRSISEELAWRIGTSFELEKGPDRKRPVLVTLVPETLYEEITQAAQTSGRTISEELVWRTNQFLQWNDILSDLDRALRFIASTENIQQEEMDKTIENAVQLINRVHKWLDDFFFTLMVKVGLIPIKEPLTSKRVVTAISRAEFPSVVENAAKILRESGWPGPQDRETKVQISVEPPAVSVEPLQNFTPELKELIIGVIKQTLAEAKEEGIIKEVPAEAKTETPASLPKTKEEKSQ